MIIFLLCPNRDYSMVGQFCMLRYHKPTLWIGSMVHLLKCCFTVPIISPIFSYFFILLYPGERQNITWKHPLIFPMFDSIVSYHNNATPVNKKSYINPRLISRRLPDLAFEEEHDRIFGCSWRKLVLWVTYRKAMKWIFENFSSRKRYHFKASVATDLLKRMDSPHLLCDTAGPCPTSLLKQPSRGHCDRTIRWLAVL